MSLCGCTCRCSCTAAAVIASVIAGVLASFLQITGVITVTTAFLWVVFGIAVGYLGIFVLASCCRRENRVCTCAALNALLVGILGTVLLALVLLAVGITATSVVSAILVGLTVFFFVLTVSAAACYVKAISGCECEA